MTFSIVNVGTIFAFERQKFERPYTQAVCFPCYYFVMSLEWNANSCPLIGPIQTLPLFLQLLAMREFCLPQLTCN